MGPRPTRGTRHAHQFSFKQKMDADDTKNADGQIKLNYSDPV